MTHIFRKLAGVSVIAWGDSLSSCVSIEEISTVLAEQEEVRCTQKLSLWFTWFTSRELWGLRTQRDLTGGSTRMGNGISVATTDQLTYLSLTLLIL